jgi:hypothetical protein
MESKEEVAGDVVDTRGEKSVLYNWIKGIIETRDTGLTRAVLLSVLLLSR